MSQTYHIRTYQFDRILPEVVTVLLNMADQVVDAAMAQGLQDDAQRTHVLSAWVVMRDPPAYPDKFAARLVTDRPTPYVLIADTLAELQALLPKGLVRSDRKPNDPPDVVEVWFAA